jgi:hypothetical protein
MKTDIMDLLPPMGASWHVQLTKKSQVLALKALIEELPGCMPIILHAEGRMRRIAPGIQPSHLAVQRLVRVFGEIREEYDQRMRL